MLWAMGLLWDGLKRDQGRVRTRDVIITPRTAYHYTITLTSTTTMHWAVGLLWDGPKRDEVGFEP